MALEQSRNAGNQKNEPGPQRKGSDPVNPQSVPAGGTIPKADFPNVSGEHGCGSIGNAQKPYRFTK